ncbi:hypothetical protein [Paraclostridium sordellii]|uniref:hypothetical protein n=1 Tax=Paraclostridium sordellii TaxID=1505 RepID=UPI000C75C825|nr:hypothetical protein [Paeniclostridium sordellii]AUN14693.1 hypothetical protein RSJ16_10875 [Paeniclostridium sordellii]MDU5019978.1 hypothetical protein [Clostridiales bacterium]
MENIKEMIRIVGTSKMDKLEKGSLDEYTNSLQLENMIFGLSNVKKELEEIFNANSGLATVEYSGNSLYTECQGDSEIVKKIVEISVVWDKYANQYIYNYYAKTLINGKKIMCVFFKSKDEKDLMNVLIQILLG